MDLGGHYRADAAAADQRYRNRSFIVRGEVIGFEKPLFVRDYKILLRTADRELKVVCQVYPPEDYKAVFTIKNGTALVGLTPREERVPLTKIGDTINVAGRCKGLRDTEVVMGGCQVKRAP